MKNCLVTKLKDVILNDDLLMINELRISFKEKPYYGNSNVDGKLALKLSITTPVKLKIIRGKAIFTEINGSQMISSNEVELTQIGYNTIHLEANSDFIISISNKNAINAFGDRHSFVNSVDQYSTPKYVSSIQLDDLKYLNQNLFCVNLNNTFIKGDISSLYQYEELNMLGLTPPMDTNTSVLNNIDNELSEVYGDINRYLLKGMTYLNVARTKLYGDIANLNTSNFKKPYSLYIYNSKIYGNLTDLNLDMTIPFDISTSNSSLNKDTAEKCGYNIYGDICKTFSYTSKSVNYKLLLMGLSSMFGNIDILHRDIYFMSNLKGESLFHYKKDTSNPRQYILALEEVHLGEYLDDYLIDMSNLKIHPKAEQGAAWFKRITVYGEKTSKSDEAVKNLQEKGISVIINRPE